MCLFQFIMHDVAIALAPASAAGRLRCRGSVLETASRPGSVPKPVRQTSREPQLVRGYGGLPSGGAGLSQPLSSALAPRRGSESAIALRFILTVVRELDVETSAATELACCGFAAGSHITHVQNPGVTLIT